MGITVAPLTTAVMTSAPSESSGTASGINNTVARTAGVLGLALAGSLAILLFGNLLASTLVSSGVPAESANSMLANAGDFGALTVPEGLSGDMATAAQEAIRWSFVQTFRVVTISAAVLAWISAGIAAVFVEGKR